MQIRNGPGRFEYGERNYTYVLDGFAKLMKWEFPGNGTASFTTQFLETESYNKSRELNDIAPYLNFGPVSPPFNQLQIIEAFGNREDNMNVNVYNMSNEFVVVSDLWKYYTFDPVTLKVGQAVNSDPPSVNNKGNAGKMAIMSSAHPVKEFGKDSYISFVCGSALLPGEKNRITVVRMTGSKREAIADWECDKAPYMHSFAVTENYAVFFAQPYFTDFTKMIKTGAAQDGMYYDEKAPTLVYVVNLKTGELTQMQIDNVFVLHHINAYEDKDGNILMDVPAQKNPYFFQGFTIEKLIHMNATARKNMVMKTTTRRYTIDLKNKTIEKFDFPNVKPNMEVPTINENYRSKKYCYIYGVMFNYDLKDYTHIAIGKQDICNSSVSDKSFYIPNHYPTEAWFVLFPPELARDEDDGFLLCDILDGDKGQSYIGIIDPKTMTLVNKAYMPLHIPFNFHGRFFDVV